MSEHDDVGDELEALAAPEAEVSAASVRMAFREGLLIEPGPHGEARCLGDLMDPWQREDFEALDRPEVRHAYLERPRGHAKTADAGVEALVEMFCNPGHDRRLFAVAADEDQAALLYEDVVGKLRRRPDLAHQVRIGTDRITVKATGTRLDVLSSDAPSAYGLRPDWLCLDELAEWRKRDLWDSLWSATGKRPEARVLCISSAGYDRDSIAWEVRQIAESEADWLLSSRGQCASWVPAAWLAQQRRTLPAHVFARLHENRWVEGAGAFLTAEEVDAVFRGALPAEFRKHMIGVDVGLTKDRTVVSVLGAGPEGLVVVRALRTWQGEPGRKVDLQEVEDEVLALAIRHHCGVVLDPYMAVQMAQRLRVKNVTVIEYTFSSASRQALFARLLDLVRRGKLQAEPHAALRTELLGLETKQTASGWRVDHKKQGFDDHAVAVALAAQRLVDLMANLEAWAGRSAVDHLAAAQAERIARQMADLTTKLLGRYGDTPDTHAKIAAITAQYKSEPDMARRHLEAWLWADTLRERLNRSTPAGRGFSAEMESDDEFDERPE